jgi:hypothetical protein
MCLVGRWVAASVLVVVVACSTSEAPESVGSSTQAVRQAPTVGAPIELSDAVKQSAAGSLPGAEIACGPSECAVVWSTYLGQHIVTGALRLARNGTVLDQDTLFLTKSGTTTVSVSAGSAGFIAVSGNNAFLFPTTSGGKAVTTLRFEGSGKLIAAIGSNGDKHLIATRTYGGPTTETLETRVVSQTDTSLPNAVTVAMVPSNDLITVAAGPSQFLVAWTDGGCVRLSPTGALLDATPIRYANRSRGAYLTHITPSAVYTGASYLIAWTAGNTIYTGRVGSNGAVLDPDDDFNNLTGSHEVCECYAQTLGAWFDGRDVILTWYGGGLAPDRKTFGARINVNTALLASAMAPDFTIDTTRVQLSYDTAGGLALLNGVTPLSVPAQNGGPVLGAPKAYRFDAEAQDSPAVASNGTGFLATWVNHDPNGQHRILATHVSATGAVLDDPPLVVGTAGPYSRVSAAWGKDSYVVVWSSSSGVFARGVGESAPAATTVTIPGVTQQQEIAVACNDEYCLAGFRPEAFNNDSVVKGIRLDAATFATVEAQVFFISDFWGDASHGLSIAADTTPVAEMRTFLVAWVSSEKKRLLTRRIRSHLGTLQEVVPVLGIDAFLYPTQPVVTSAGTDFAVIHNGNYADGAQLFRVNAISGVADAGTWVNIDRGSFPTVSHDGIDYMTTFFDLLADATPARMAVRVDAAGTRVDSSGFLVTSSALVANIDSQYRLLYQSTPGSASDKTGHTLLAYPVADPNTLTMRVRAQLLTNTTDEVVTGEGGAGGEAPIAQGGENTGGSPPSAGNGGANVVGGASMGEAGFAQASGGEGGIEAGAGPVEPSAGNGPGTQGGTTSQGGGAVSGSSTGGATAGAASSGASTDADSGCGCRVPPSRGRALPALALLLAIGGIRLRRSRRRSGHF